MKKLKIGLIVLIAVLTVAVVYAFMSKQFVSAEYEINFEQATDYEGFLTDEEKDLAQSGYFPYFIEFTVKNPSFINFEYLRVNNITSDAILFYSGDTVSPFFSGASPLSKQSTKSIIWIKDGLSKNEVEKELGNTDFNGYLIYYSPFSADEKMLNITFKEQ